MSRSVLFLLRTICLSAMWFQLSATSLAQAAPEQTADSLQLKTVAAMPASSPTDQPADSAVMARVAGETVAGETAAGELAEESVPELFQLPREQHPWARFQAGAWRELKIVSETFAETGQTSSRSVTTQKEVLQAVAEGKYVLNVQATVDLGGKRIVSDWKTRVLSLATDGAGLLVDSRRLDNQLWQFTGRTAECQVWELGYRDGARQLIDQVFYDPQQFPYVLRRETVVNDHAGTATPTGAAVAVEQLIEVMAASVPYALGEALVDCSCLRTLRHHSKGDTIRLTFISRPFPGGEVAVWSTDSDSQGRRLRSSVTVLQDYGETAPDNSALP